MGLRRQAPVSLAALWITERHYYYGAACCRLEVAVERVENSVIINSVITLFKNGFHIYTQMLKCSLKRWWLGLCPRSPKIANGTRTSCVPASLARRVANGDITLFKNWFHSHSNAHSRVGGWGLDGLTHRVENGVKLTLLFKNGFQLHPNVPKSVGSWGSAPQLGLCPRSSNSEGERLRRLPVWHAEGEGRHSPSLPRAPETLGTPLWILKHGGPQCRKRHWDP